MLSFKLPLNEQIQSLGIVKKYPGDSIILEENNSIKNIPIVVKGSMKVFRTEEDGREILLYYIKEGESCIMSILGSIHMDTSKVRVITEEESEVLFIPISKMSLLIKQNPEWLDFVLELYHKRFEELLSVINEMAFQKLDERILKLLQKKAALHHNKEINITHQQLSEELGATREVISRLLKQMENQKIVKLFRNKIVLV
ncbi:MAG: Crp/Fnr family transcriptional regulator [Bacteroidota bacterium]|nr:Crp/Fnr family transcriptional regulator [Bacteroidota bacterium]